MQVLMLLPKQRLAKTTVTPLYAKNCVDLKTGKIGKSVLYNYSPSIFAKIGISTFHSDERRYVGLFQAAFYSRNGRGISPFSI